MAIEVGGGSGENSSYHSVRNLGSAKTEYVLASSLYFGTKDPCQCQRMGILLPPPKVSFKELDNRVALYGMLNHSWKWKNMEALWFDKPLRYVCVCVRWVRAPPVASWMS